MAGERKGKTYEALFDVVLEEALLKSDVSGYVFWNVKAAGMTVVPDFTIGKTSDRPSHVFMITHSGSAKESEKKNWRNLGELAECKLRLKTIPRVFNVAFDSIVKERLKKVAKVAFDGQLIVGDRPYGEQLIDWIDNNHGKLPKKAIEKADAIRSILDDKKPGFKKLFNHLVADVIELLPQKNPSLASLWRRERQRTQGSVPTSKTTSIRRGMSKLLIFEDIDLAVKLYGRRKVQSLLVPQYAFELGLARKTIGAVSYTHLTLPTILLV